MTSGAPGLLVIAVHYRTPGVTARFAAEIRKQAVGISIETILVDNSPLPTSDAIPASVANLPGTRVLRPGTNLGYFHGAAAALADHLSRSQLPDWVIVTNTDIEFMAADVLGTLGHYQPDASVGLVAPCILSSITGRDQNPYMRNRPSRFRMRFYSLVFATYATGSLYQAASWIKVRVIARYGGGWSHSSPAPGPIYAPHGSFIAFHRKYFEAGGRLSFQPFLFGEEICVAEEARRLNLRVLYDPVIRVGHAEHVSIGGVWSRQSAKSRREASRYIRRAYF